MSEVTVKELDDLGSDIFELKTQKDALEDQLSEINKTLQAKERKCIEIMRELKLETFKGSRGTLTPYDKTSYAVPKTEEDRAKFFDYLKQHNVFDGMVTVHHATLNAYVTQAYNEAKEKGDIFFTVPGLGAPTITTILSKTKAKGKP